MFPYEIIGGTTYFSRTDIDEQRIPKDSRSRWIALEHVVVSNFTLASAPRQAHVRPQLRPEVIASLERSLKEHADVWAELSKH